MAGLVKSGGELPVNGATASMQHYSRVAMLPGGGFVVVWNSVDYAQDGDGGAIKGQRFDASGAKVGGEFLVNSSYAGSQTTPAVTAFADGSFAVAWATNDPAQDGNGGAIKARLFSAAGTPAGGEFLVNMTNSGTQNAPNITTLSNGSFLVSWDDAGSGDVYGRLYKASGTAMGGDFRLNTSLASGQNFNDVTALSGGGFVAVWRTSDSSQDGSGESVKGQVYDQYGGPIGREFLVNTNTLGSQNDPSVAALSNGGFVVTWVTSWNSEDGSSSAIKAQIFNPHGDKYGPELLVNTKGAQAQQEPVATALGDGGFMIAWLTLDGTQDGSGLALKAQAFDAGGARIGSEFLVNTQAKGDQSTADMATLSDGRVIVTWTDTYGDGPADWGIKAQLFAPEPTAPTENQAPVITSDGGGDSATRTVDENATVAATITVADPNGDPVAYVIVGGTDAARFTIGQSGTLSFVSAPNFEAPGDADGDNVYEVIVGVHDGKLKDVQTLSIRVANVDEPVTFTSSNNLIVPEGHRGPFAVKAVDPDNPSGSVVYYINSSGTDSKLFSIDPTTGALSFNAPPDFEAPADAGGDNVYDLAVIAKEGETYAIQNIRITVYNHDEPAVIGSNGGGASAAISNAEGATAVTTVAATDPEGAAVTYSIVGGADAALFSIDPRTGALAFAAAPDFEAPRDSDRDNVYEVEVSASDGRFSDRQKLSVTVDNAYEGVRFDPSRAVTVHENAVAAGGASATGEAGASFTYSIGGGADAALFTVDAATGALSFRSAPDFERPADAGRDNVYDVVVTASDGRSSASQSVTVTVGNTDEAVAVSSYAGATTAAVSVTENGSAVGRVEATDPDGQRVTYAIAGGADAALFTVDADTGVLSFLSGSAPDFESPADAGRDNVYDVVVSASSATSSVSQAFAVSIVNQNEGIFIRSNGGGTSAAISVSEGERIVTTVSAFDPDGTAPAYSITGGPDAALFTIDAVTGVLSFIAAPDFEAPGSSFGENFYTVEVTASDGEQSSWQKVQILIANVNEGLSITSPASVATLENRVDVTVVAARDVDGDAVTFSIAGGADAAKFSIDAKTGALRFLAAPDYEAPGDTGGDNVYDVVIAATDGSFTATQSLSIAVGGVNEAVRFESDLLSLSIGENEVKAGKLAAYDPEGAPLTYAIAGGADAALFEIDARTGELRFVNAPDFEAPRDADRDNLYAVTVSASDGVTSGLQQVTVQVGNRDEALSLVSYGGSAAVSLSLGENGRSVGRVSAVDTDGDPVTYSIAGGADAALFTIDAATGALSFIAAPDFEAKTDADRDNVYQVQVAASSTVFKALQSFAVTLTNVDEALAITSNGGGGTASVSAAENSLAVITVVAADPDGGTVTYSIAGGADAARFTIDAKTGVLQFSSAPDYEAPVDANGDNLYDVIVRASDGVFEDLQQIGVAVTNTRDGRTITGTSGADTISGTSTNTALRTTNAEDTVYGRDGNDTIQGMGGDDHLFGEGGKDTLTGGAGADRLTGGLAADQFVYTAVSDSTAAARDVITDFTQGQNDRISLSGIDANSLVSGDQAFTFIGTNAFSKVAGQLRYEVSGGDTFVYGDVNGDGNADFQLQLTGSVSLVSSDFFL